MAHTARKLATQHPSSLAIPVASSHIPHVSQERLCSYPKPTMGMVTRLPHLHTLAAYCQAEIPWEPRCALVAMLVGTVVAGPPSSTSPGPATTAKGQYRGVLSEAKAQNHSCAGDVTDWAYVCVLGQAEGRGVHCMGTRCYLRSGTTLYRVSGRGSAGWTQSIAAAPKEVFM